MIQRIQTIWLGLAALCLGGLFLTASSHSIQYLSFNLGESQKTGFWLDPSFAKTIFLLAAAVAAAAIFLFRNRTLQIWAVRVGLFLAFLGGILVGLCASSEWQVVENAASGEKTRFGFTIALPVLAIAFLGLALAAIRKDEKLVRSIDRLR